MIADSPAIVRIKGVNIFEQALVTKTSGPNFCHVERRIHVVQFNEFITDGNQKWKGATPNLIAAPIINMEFKGSNEAANRMNLDPNA